MIHRLAGNLYNRIGTLVLPEGFKTAALSQNIPTNNNLTWVISAPDTVVSAENFQLTFGAFGYDVNNDSQISMMDTVINIRVEPKAAGNN